MYSSKRFCSTLLSCLLGIILLAACSPSPTQSASSTKQSVDKSTATSAPGALHCQPPSPTTASATGQPEVRGTTRGQTELWALLFQPLVAKKELKIVWRMTGKGDLQVVAQGPHGESVQPKWLEAHNGSNWERPGDEWGTGFILSTSGCWNFHASRADTTGNIWLLVK